MTWHNEPQRHSLARRGIRTSICAPISKNQADNTIINKRIENFSFQIKKLEQKLKTINNDTEKHGHLYKNKAGNDIPANNAQLEHLQSEYQYLVSNGNDRQIRSLKLKCPKAMRIVENKRR